MARTVLLLCLLAAAVAAESPETETARRFLQLHRAKRTKQQHLLAMTAEVQWPLVADWLLRRREPEAARELAALRAGAPDGPGLKRLVEAWVPPGEERYAAYAEARVLLARGRAGDALAALRRIGPAAPASVFGAQVELRRADALVKLGRKADAYEAFGRACAIAKDVGWWLLLREAAQRRIGVAADPDERLAAADDLVAATKAIGDTPRYVAALQLRARVRIGHAGAATTAAERTKRLTAARRDFAAALALVSDTREQARIHRNIAVLWQVYELPPRPRQALKSYEESMALLRELPADRRGDLPGVLYNASLVATMLGRYETSLAYLDELRELSAELRPRALQQRAYVLWRQRRLEKAAAAYDEALAAAPEADRARLHLDACELHMQRGDPERARRHAAAAPATPRGRITRARVSSRLGDLEQARAGFAAGLADVRDPVMRVRFQLLHAAELRSWGDVDGAFAAVGDALATIEKTPDFSDVGNAAVTWLVAGDLALLQGRRDAAEKMLGNAASIFLKLDDPQRAVPAYVQWTLLLVSLERMEPALQRLGVLLKRADATSSPALKSSAKVVEAIFEARAGRVDGAPQLLEKAVALAREAGDRLREATALAHLALFQPERAVALVDRAYALLDAERVDGPEEHPLLEGHRPDYAGSIAVAALLKQEAPDAAAALRFVERRRAERLLLARRGRDAVLARHGEAAKFAVARGALVEARVEDAGVAEAEAAFDAYVADLRRRRPALADLAFPRAPDLAAVQAALRPDEALLVMLDDPYVPGAVVAVTRAGVALRRVDAKDPLASAAAELEGKRRVIVVPDGRWALRPLATAKWKDGIGADAFRFHYVASTAAFARARERPAPPPAAPVVATTAPRVDLVHPQATRVGDLPAAATIVFPAVDLRPGPRAEGLGALAAAATLRGVDTVIVSLGGAPPPALLARFRANAGEKKMAPGEALHEAQQWFRRSGTWKKEAEWAGLVCYGVPR